MNEIALATRDGVQEALAKAESIQDVMEIRNQYELVKTYLKQQGAEQSVVNQYAENKIRIERMLGKHLETMEKDTGGRPPNNRFHDGTGSPPTLAELGIGKTQSHRWQIMASVPEDAFEEFVAKTINENGELTSRALYELGRKLAGKVHVGHSTGNNEWYTPEKYIEAARAVLGTIDLDPASSDKANETVGADFFFTAEDDGLSQPWAGRVWMNPPYSSDLIGKFSGKLSQHYADGDITAAIVLVNNATETAWFQAMLVHASAVCFIRGRVRFIDMNGQPSGAPLQGQTILYLGGDAALFAEHFSQFGVVLYAR